MFSDYLSDLKLPIELYAASDSVQYMVLMLGMLHALRQHHQFTHWTLTGMHFYGDHLLFQRLYEETIPDEIDSLAEKILGTKEISSEVLQPQVLLTIMQEFLATQEHVTAGPIRALHLESAFVGFIEKFFQEIKDAHQMSLGTDDLIMSIASNHETHIYLLKQRLKECSMVREAVRQLKASGNVDIDSAMILQSPNIHREVRDLANSRSLTNDPEVMENILKNKMIRKDQSLYLEETPPTPEEILEDYSYSNELGTLSRNLVEKVARKHLTRRG